MPTSAHSGDGMGNLLALICELTQTMLARKVSYSEELQCTVMEVSVHLIAFHFVCTVKPVYKKHSCAQL